MMSDNGKRSAWEMLFLSIWGMVTLVLFFCVILLVREMLRQGQDPLASFREAKAPVEASLPPPETTGTGEVRTQEIKLFFSTPDGLALTPESRSVTCGASTVENCRAALQALIAGPQKETSSPLFPASVKIRALYLLENGDLCIDFSSEMKTEHARFKSAALEILMAQGVLHTVTQAALQSAAPPTVQRVQFLFDGFPQDTFPAHIDLSGPQTPDFQWVEAAPAGSGNG